jgi:hypothetical protein
MTEQPGIVKSARQQPSLAGVVAMRIRWRDDGDATQEMSR